MNEIVKSNEVQAIEAVSMVEGYVNTLDLSTIEGKMATVNAYNGAESLAHHVGEVLEICNVVTMPGMRKSRIIGQPDIPCQNTYLIDTEGNAYFTQSDGVARSVNVIVAMFPAIGKDTERGCLPMTLKEQVLPNGNTLKTIDVVS